VRQKNASAEKVTLKEKRGGGETEKKKKQTKKLVQNRHEARRPFKGPGKLSEKMEAVIRGTERFKPTLGSYIED